MTSASLTILLFIFMGSYEQVMSGRGWEVHANKSNPELDLKLVLDNDEDAWAHYEWKIRVRCETDYSDYNAYERGSARVEPHGKVTKTYEDVCEGRGEYGGFMKMEEMELRLGMPAADGELTLRLPSNLQMSGTYLANGGLNLTVTCTNPSKHEVLSYSGTFSAKCLDGGGDTVTLTCPPMGPGRTESGNDTLCGWSHGPTQAWQVGEFQTKVDTKLLLASAPKDPPPKPLDVGIEQTCPQGMERGEYTLEHCCWPGQAWNGQECVGSPAACPEPLVPAGETCSEPECPSGMEIHQETICCWAGQGFDAGCYGTPTCLAPLVPKGEDCVEPVECRNDRVRTTDGLHCCWGGQRWEDGECRGEPICPAGLAAAGMDCVSAINCETPMVATADRKHCCLPGQAWAGRCVGEPLLSGDLEESSQAPAE